MFLVERQWSKGHRDVGDEDTLSVGYKNGVVLENGAGS